MAIYFTSDTHFGHENVISFSNRPFENLEEMEKVLIENWNARVRPNDDIYIIGDFAWRAKHDHIINVLKRLNGQKHLILGNHDRKYLDFDDFRASFVEIEKQLEVFVENRQRLVLCHYPMAEWHQYHRGIYHIHGHLHNRKDEAFLYLKDKNALNAGVDINNFMPVTFEELIVNNKIFKENDLLGIYQI